MLSERKIEHVWTGSSSGSLLVKQLESFTQLMIPLHCWITQYDLKFTLKTQCNGHGIHDRKYAKFSLSNPSKCQFVCFLLQIHKAEMLWIKSVCQSLLFFLESSVKQYSSNLKLYPISSHSEFSFLIKYLHFVLHIYRKARRTAEDNKTSMAVFFKLVSILNAPF